MCVNWNSSRISTKQGALQRREPHSPLKQPEMYRGGSATLLHKQKLAETSLFFPTKSRPWTFSTKFQNRKQLAFRLTSLNRQFEGNLHFRYKRNKVNQISLKWNPKAYKWSHTPAGCCRLNNCPPTVHIKLPITNYVTPFSPPLSLQRPLYRRELPFLASFSPPETCQYQLHTHSSKFKECSVPLNTPTHAVQAAFASPGHI